MIIIDDDGVMHKVLPIDTLDKITDEIKTYEADCILADDSKECKECDKIVFGSIYRIIDKYREERANEIKSQRLLYIQRLNLHTSCNHFDI